jgi:lysophospholipase L1-like esterase
VIAQATNVPPNGYVRFVLDDVEVLDDFVPPYDQTFASVGPGDHDVAAILRSQSGAELDRDTNVLVGRGGEYEIAIGDSITNGTGDDFRTDNLTNAPRIVSFGGYPAPLTALLDATDPTHGKYLVFNEGIGGDTSHQTAFVRLDSIQARHPLRNRMLILLGTNDAIRTIPSGLGCAGTACTDTYKGNMQQLIDKIRWSDYPTNTVPSGITVVVARVPPMFTSASPWNSPINDLIRSYNTVIDTELVGREIGPDLFGYFMAGATSNLQTLFADEFHPNSLGHVAVSVLWHNVLHPSSPLPLPFVLDGLVSLGAGAPIQTLLEAGNRLYRDDTFKVSSIPPELNGGRWIVSSNADKATTAGNYLTFNVDRPVDVYVAYDSAASALPGWMAGFSATGLVVQTTNPATPSMSLYVKSFAIGPIVLGGNLQPPAVGANANYVAIVVES